MKILKKLTATIIPVLAGVFLFAGVASAHVTVKPNISAPGAWETYTIKIPTEKEVPTTKVTLKMPDGVEFEQYQPSTGWKVTTKKDSSGKVTTITWIANGQGILPGQFQQFNFVAKNPNKEGQAAWDAYQYYKDGTIVEWTGDEKSQTPHSITKITSSQVNDGVAPNVTTQKEVKQDGSKTTTLETTTLILSIIAILIALFAAVKSRKK